MKFIKMLNIDSIGGENNPSIFELSEEERTKVGLSESQKYLTCVHADVDRLYNNSFSDDEYNKYIIEILSEINNRSIDNYYEGFHETIKECEYFIMMHYYKDKLNSVKHEVNAAISDIKSLLK